MKYYYLHPNSRVSTQTVTPFGVSFGQILVVEGMMFAPDEFVCYDNEKREFTFKCMDTVYYVNDDMLDIVR